MAQGGLAPKFDFYTCAVQDVRRPTVGTYCRFKVCISQSAPAVSATAMMQDTSRQGPLPHTLGVPLGPLFISKSATLAHSARLRGFSNSR